MHFRIPQLIIPVLLFAISTNTARAFLYLTNETAIANGRVVIAAINSGDTQSKTNPQALIGSLIAFSAEGLGELGTTNLTTPGGGITVKVEKVAWPELKAGEFINHCDFGVELLGTLKKIDFEQKVIYIAVKPGGYMVTAGF